MLYQTKNPHGGDVYSRVIHLDFSANTNPLGTPPGVLRAVQECLGELHRYPDPHCRKLIEAISAFEGVPESAILCGAGAAELIYGYCQAMRPRKAAELAPTFCEYALALDRVGCETVRYVLKKEDLFDPDEGLLPWLEEEKPEVLFLCNPNNPTGRLMDEGLLRKLLSFSSRRGMALFVDECFLDLSSGGESLKPYLYEHPRLFLLKAFTKSYGLAGLRLGYGLCADDSLLAAMARQIQPWNVSTPAQAAGVAALKETAFLERTRALIARERPWLHAELEKLGLWVCPSRVNFLLFQGPEGLDKALEAQKIALRPCGNYHGLSNGWYRTAVRRHEENQALVRALKEVL